MPRSRWRHAQPVYVWIWAGPTFAVLLWTVPPGHTLANHGELWLTQSEFRLLLGWISLKQQLCVKKLCAMLRIWVFDVICGSDKNVSGVLSLPGALNLTKQIDDRAQSGEPSRDYTLNSAEWNNALRIVQTNSAAAFKWQSYLKHIIDINNNCGTNLFLTLNIYHMWKHAQKIFKPKNALIEHTR